MTLGSSPKPIRIQLEPGSPTAHDGPNTYPRHWYMTKYAATTNPESAEHMDPDDSSMLARPTDSETISLAAGLVETPSSRFHEPLSAGEADRSPWRSRASTPKSPDRQSSYTSTPSRGSEAGWDQEERGRTRAKLECIIPPRSRKISKKSIERHVGQSKSGSDSADVETFLTSESPSPSNTSKEAEDLLLEPSPPEYVTRGFTQRLSGEASPASPEEGIPFPHDHESNVDLRPPQRLTDAQRLSIVEHIHFPHHRDTFAILELPKNRYQSPPTPTLSNLPYSILCRLNTYLGHRSRLALRLTSRWLSGCITEIHPLRFPAVSNLPAEMIQEIMSYLSPFDFNSARHTCRAWMRVSLDKNLLARMVRKGGWWSSVEMAMRLYLVLTGVDEDDFPAVWHLSSLVARECAFTSHWTGKGLSTSRGPRNSMLRHTQIDGAFDADITERPHASPFELTLETDFSALGDPKVFGNAVPTYARARGLRDGVQFTASVCGRFVLVTKNSQIFVYRLSHALPNEGGKPDSRVQFSSNLPNTSANSRIAVIYPVTTIICPRRVVAVSMDTSCGRHAVAALLDDRMGLVCDLYGSEDTPSARACSSEVGCL